MPNQANLFNDETYQLWCNLIVVLNMRQKFTPEYLAGLFDADGLFTLHGRSDGYVMCHVSFIMNSLELLEELHKLYPALNSIIENQE